MDEKTTLHIVFGMSAAGSIRQALRQIGCTERVVGFMDDLSFGPIDRATTRSRENWIADELGDAFHEVCREADRSWAEATASNIAPVAWVCRNHALEYSGYLEFVCRMEGRPFRVIDASDVSMPRSPAGKLWSLGILNPTKIIEAGLLDCQRNVSAEENARHRDLWTRLKAENAPFRVVDASGLVSASITHFDEAIMTRVTSDWTKGARVVGEAMGELIDRPFSQCPGDMVVWARICALAEMGRVEMDGPGPSMREHRVRLPSGRPAW